MKKIFSISLLLSLIITLIPEVYATHIFSDVDHESEFAPYIHKLYEKGIVSGINGMYYSKTSTSREELVKMSVIGGNFTLSNNKTPYFPDVDQSNPLFKYVQTGKKNGLINGYLDGTFKPYRKIKRDEAAKIMVNLHQTVTGLHVDINPAQQSFSDVSTSHPLFVFIEQARALGITTGYADGTFKPEREINREEMSKFLSEALGISTFNGGGGATACNLPSGVVVYAEIVHDNTEGTAKDFANVLINDGGNLEMPINCDAEVKIIVNNNSTTLKKSPYGSYQAGESEIDPNLPPLTLYPSIVHYLEIDLSADGSIDITGEVTLSDVKNFTVTSSTSSQVSFSWSDSGSVNDTTYYVQVSDQSDFYFPENFASGMATSTTSIQFGGSSQWPYFDFDNEPPPSPPFYARIQADTNGTITSSGRFRAWQYPIEPILQYQ